MTRTRLTALSVVPTGTDSVLADLHRCWWSFAGPQGGLLAGLALRAAETQIDGRTPRSVSTHFLAPAAEGPLTLGTTLLRAGGSAVVSVQAPAILHSTVLAGRSRGTGTHDGVPPPATAPPENCPVENPRSEAVPFSAAMAWRPVASNPLFGGQHPQTLAGLPEMMSTRAS